MESIIAEDSPLGEHLEGTGLQDGLHTPSNRSSNGGFESWSSFAPTASKALRGRKRGDRMSQLMKNHGRRISVAWTHAVDPSSKHDERSKFLDHFRYVVIASQLLEERADRSALIDAQKSSPQYPGGPNQRGTTLHFTNLGIAVTVCVPLAAVLLVKHFSHYPIGASHGIALLLLLLATTSALSLIIPHRRLQNSRRLVLDTTEALVKTLQQFELHSGTCLTLIQEVEVVSKGYRFSTPLPPVSRLDDPKDARRCIPLRKELSRVYQKLPDVLSKVYTQLQHLVSEDDYERFLDVYDLSMPAVDEAFSTSLPDDMDTQSLSALRLQNVRTNIMRRATLCSLLAISDDPSHDSYAYWPTVISAMAELSKSASTLNRYMAESLRALEDVELPTTPSSASRSRNIRLNTQLGRIATLSTGLRALQAKMTLLREESNTIVSTADDLTDLGPLLMSRYESIGTDIQALLQDWQTGKAALSTSISKQERRISQASTLVLSPESHNLFGGLGPVIEGGPEDALRALTGEGLADKDSSSSRRSSMSPTPTDEEVFEAVSMPLPKKRSSISREQRIRLMHEERARAEERREVRESGVNMIKELRTVISLRKRSERTLPPALRVATT